MNLSVNYDSLLQRKDPIISNELVYERWERNLGLIDQGPELKVQKKELWRNISSEAKQVFKVIIQSPEEIYTVIDGNKKKSSNGDGINRVGKTAIRAYVRKKYGRSLRESNKIFEELIKYSVTALSLEKIFLKNI